MAAPERVTERYQRRDRRALWWGLGISVLFHVLVFLWFEHERVVPSVMSAAGPEEGDDAAAAGGGMQAVELRIAEPQPIPRPPEPVFVPDITVQPVVEQEPSVAQVDVSQLLGNAPGEQQGDAPGREDGTGRGNGGSDAAGRNRPMPVPRGLFLPPNEAPKAIRGREVTVYVFVDRRGRPVADSTNVLPRSGDRSYDRAMLERANEWVFDPARQNGEPIAAWFRYSFTVSD